MKNSLVREPTHYSPPYQMVDHIYQTVPRYCYVGYVGPVWTGRGWSGLGCPGLVWYADTEMQNVQIIYNASHAYMSL